MTNQGVHDFLKWFFKMNGFAPSITEVAKGVGVSRTDAAYHLKKLERDGKIQRVARTTRAIRMVR